MYLCIHDAKSNLLTYMGNKASFPDTVTFLHIHTYIYTYVCIPIS